MIGSSTKEPFGFSRVHCLKLTDCSNWGYSDKLTLLWIRDSSATAWQATTEPVKWQIPLAVQAYTGPGAVGKCQPVLGWRLRYATPLPVFRPQESSSRHPLAFPEMLSTSGRSIVICMHISFMFARKHKVQEKMQF